MVLGMIIIGLLAAGCGERAAPETTPAAAPPSSTPTSTPSSFVPTVSPSDATSPSPTDVPSETAAPADEESDKPPVLDEQATGRDLTTADFFTVPQDWRDGRFDVAGQQDLGGVAGPLSNCSREPDDYSPTIELRLANNFSKISLKLGQSDDSASSDVDLNVNLVGNGKYIDTVRVPFNKIQSLQASVVNVNALMLQFWMSGEECDGRDEIEAVLMGLRVE